MYELSSADLSLSHEGDWKYIDKKGNFLFENLKIEKGEDFHNGFARVKINGSWGYINEKGELVINPQFGGCFDFMEVE